MHSSWKSRGVVLGVFWQILLRGVLGVVRKSVWVGGLLYCIFMWKFSKIFIGGTWGASLSPPVHLCQGVHKMSNLKIFFHYGVRKHPCFITLTPSLVKKYSREKTSTIYVVAWIANAILRCSLMTVWTGVKGYNMRPLQGEFSKYSQTCVNGHL